MPVAGERWAESDPSACVCCLPAAFVEVAAPSLGTLGLLQEEGGLGMTMVGCRGSSAHSCDLIAITRCHLSVGTRVVLIFPPC